MSVYDMKRNETREISSIPSGEMGAVLTRMGICQGKKISLFTRSRIGAIVIKSGAQEIAIGNSLAKQIMVC